MRRSVAKPQEDKKKGALSAVKIISLAIPCGMLSGFIRIFISGKGGSFLTAAVYGLTTGEGIKLTLILLTVFMVIVLIMNQAFKEEGDEYDEERNLTKSSLGTQGTSKLMNVEEIKEVYGIQGIKEEYDGFVIGQIEDKKENGKYRNKVVTRSEKIMAEQHLTNRNVMVLGSPGTGKTAGIIKQNVYECGNRGESMFITDPKGDIANDCYPYLSELGYDVKIFNLINPHYSDGWNVMQWLSTLGKEQEKWVNTIGAMIIKNTAGDSGESFWDNVANMLLKSVMSLLLEIASPTDKVTDSTIEVFEDELKKLRKGSWKTISEDVFPYV